PNPEPSSRPRPVANAYCPGPRARPAGGPPANIGSPQRHPTVCRLRSRLRMPRCQHRLVPAALDSRRCEAWLIPDQSLQATRGPSSGSPRPTRRRPDHPCPTSSHRELLRETAPSWWYQDSVRPHAAGDPARRSPVRPLLVPSQDVRPTPALAAPLLGGEIGGNLLPTPVLERRPGATVHRLEANLDLRAVDVVATILVVEDESSAGLPDEHATMLEALSGRLVVDLDPAAADAGLD